MISDKSASLSISVKELTKRYGHVYALNNVSIDVKAGEFLTLLGPSGSGKTTLLMAIAGFNRPDSGGVYFGKQDVTVLPPHKRGVGMVFQNYALFPHMSVFDNVAFPLKLRKIEADEKHRRVTEALKKVQLTRAAAYPSLQEQMDMQYWDSVNGTTTWKDAIAKVKADNPKPS